MNRKNEILSYLENMSLLVLGVALFAFPLIFSSLTTDAFVLPKQLLLGGAVLVSLLLFGVRMVTEGKVRLRTTPFDLPLLLFTVVAFISSYLAVNRYDALINFVPLLFAVLAYFVIVNVVRGRAAILFLVSCLVGGAVISSILTILSALHLYILPFQYARVETFSSLGSLLDQAIYLVLVLPVAGYLAYPLIHTVRRRNDQLFSTEETAGNTGVLGIFAGAFIIMTIGLITTGYLLVAKQKPLILPFETGFQTAFAAISQDAGRRSQSFLFGSGVGTYVTDFTRFKQASYNTNEALWSFTFFRSSSFVLELLATVGLLGFLTYGLIAYRFFRMRTFYLPVVLAFALSLVLPFSFILQALLFILLAVFAVLDAQENPKNSSDLEFYFVALKNGLVTTEEGVQRREQNAAYARILPVLLFIVMIGLVGSLAFLSYRYILSDVTFQKSLVAASQNNGAKTYELQGAAINTFPYRDSYLRIFSQTNLALANSLSASQPKGSSPSAQVQQQILTLIQQSINAGRSAVSVAPQNVSNWNNLSSIYRSLIGFGENADQFSIATNQQAIQLDGANPQQYINLGGIYYQLQQWDLAQSAFLTAVQLKPDYANAHYNLGHALESKGDLQNALQQYLAVQELVVKDKENSKSIAEEIKALQAKIGTAEQNAAQSNAAAGTQDPALQQEPLDVNKPTTQLPAQQQKAQIPGPTVTPIPSPTVTPAVSTTPAAGTTVTPTPNQ